MKIFSFGEALIDFLSSKHQKDRGEVTETFIKYAGGAPANVAVATAKLGIESYLIGKIGKDSFGDFLIKSLNSFGVSTQYVNYSKKGKTALAFVSLDNEGERSFQFYDTNAAHYDVTTQDFDNIELDEPAIFNFNSGALSKPYLKNIIDYGIKKFQENDSIICFDINFRSSFWSTLEGASDIILEVASKVNIIKASREELIELYKIENIETIIKLFLSEGVQLILITDGSKPISYHTNNFKGTFSPPEVNAVDTTSAGDAFIGGFLSKVASDNSSLTMFNFWVTNFENVISTIHFSSQCGAFTVSKFGAFDALPHKSDID